MNWVSIAGLRMGRGGVSRTGLVGNTNVFVIREDSREPLVIFVAKTIFHLERNKMNQRERKQGRNSKSGLRTESSSNL